MVLQLFLNSLRSWLFWFTVVTAIMILVLFITRGFRTSINSLTINGNTLSIRWYNRLRIRRINVNKIEEIATTKSALTLH